MPPVRDPELTCIRCEIALKHIVVVMGVEWRGEGRAIYIFRSPGLWQGYDTLATGLG